MSNVTRMPVRVLLMFGDQAELTTPHRDHTDPVRVPAADIAAALEVPAEQLPGRELVALVGDGGELLGFEPA